MKQNTIWTGVLAVASAFALLLTGCGKSQTAARDTSAKQNESSSAAETSAAEETSPAVEQADFQLKPYAMDGVGCAVEVPDSFTADSSRAAISGHLSFNGTETDDCIVAAVYDAKPEETFDAFQENDLFELLTFSTTLPQVQYFRETEIPNADGVSCKAYVGETLGTIAGKDAYVTILAANCPEENKLFVFSMRDMTGEFQNYRDKLADHIYLNQNGYVVENDQLTDAPEPEPLSYSNDAIGYQISLPEGWERLTDTSSSYGLETITSSFDNYDLFLNRDMDYALIAAKSMSVSDTEFYAAIKQNQSAWVGAGGHELVTSNECTVLGYAAYQRVINHNAGADKTSSVAWFINKTGDNPEMLAIRYCYQEDSAAEFADTLINSITLQ